MFGRRNREQAAERRRALQQQVEAQGWTWQDAQPAPAFEIREAALRGRNSLGIWTIGIADVIDGTVGARTFRAGRLVGYEYSTTNGGIPYGDLRETNAVWMPLPAALPEIRLVDTTGTTIDRGLSLPPLAPLPTPDGRWRVEGFIPAFATDLLQTAFTSGLAALPPLSAVVIRAGVIIAYGAPALDAEAVRTVAAVLSALLDAVPASAWGRADALVSGTGVFPRHAGDGARLVLDERLVRPDWRGNGLSEKVPWQDAPDAPKNVTLMRREARELWPTPPEAPPGLSLSVKLGDVRIGSPTPLGIPTVASTLTAGGTGPEA